VWGYDFFGEGRVVDVHLGHIRQKLGDSRFIVTVHRAGYHFEDGEWSPWPRGWMACPWGWSQIS
jgi:hypothetical protein